MYNLNKLPERKSLIPYGFEREFNQMFKEIIPIIHNLFQKIQVEGMLPNSFYEVSVNLIPNQAMTMKESKGREGKRRERKYRNHIPVSLMNLDSKICN